jgi:hypothetical protein
LNSNSPAGAESATLPELNPGWSCKIRRLCNVRSHVETPMVSLGETDHDVSFALRRLTQKKEKKT